MQMIPHFFYARMDPGDSFVSKGYLVCSFLWEASVCFSPHKSGKGYRCLMQEKSWTILTQRRRSGWLSKICLDLHNLEEQSKCELYYRQTKQLVPYARALLPSRDTPSIWSAQKPGGNTAAGGGGMFPSVAPLTGADGRVKRFQMLPFSICGYFPLLHLTTITKKRGQGLLFFF